MWHMHRRSRSRAPDHITHNDRTLIVVYASAFTAKPITAAARNNPGFARTMARSPAVQMSRISHTAEPNSSQTQHAGAKYIRPSMGWNLWPTSKNWVITKRIDSAVSEENIRIMPTIDIRTSPYAATAVPTAVSSTDAIMVWDGSSNLATKRQTIVTTGVNALSICSRQQAVYKKDGGDWGPRDVREMSRDV